MCLAQLVRNVSTSPSESKHIWKKKVSAFFLSAVSRFGAALKIIMKIIQIQRPSAQQTKWIWYISFLYHNLLFSFTLSAAEEYIQAEMRRTTFHRQGAKRVRAKRNFSDFRRIWLCNERGKINLFCHQGNNAHFFGQFFLLFFDGCVCVCVGAKSGPISCTTQHNTISNQFPMSTRALSSLCCVQCVQQWVRIIVKRYSRTDRTSIMNNNILSRCDEELQTHSKLS